MENQEQKKASKKNVIMPILLIAGSILVAYFMAGVGPAPEKFQINPSVLVKIDSLEKVNKKLMLENIKLDSILGEYKLRVDDLDWRIGEIMKSRSSAQDKYHQRAEAARSEGAEATQEFFKQRYNF